MPEDPEKNIQDQIDTKGEENYQDYLNGKEIDLSEYDLSIEDQEVLKEALKIFRDTKGAAEKNGPLCRLLRKGLKGSNSLGVEKGAMYELQKALELCKKGEKIEASGVKYTMRNIKTCEFDIETTSKLIECKNIEWDLIRDQKAVQRLQDSLVNHKKVAEEFVKKQFELHSKNIIPDSWKQWLVKKGIIFFEG